MNMKIVKWLLIIVGLTIGGLVVFAFVTGQLQNIGAVVAGGAASVSSLGAAAKAGARARAQKQEELRGQDLSGNTGDERDAAADATRRGASGAGSAFRKFRGKYRG